MNSITLFKNDIGELLYKSLKEYDLSIYWSQDEVSPNNISSPALFILNKDTTQSSVCDYTVPVSFVFLLQNSDMPDFREDERILEDMALKLINIINEQRDYELGFNRKSRVMLQMAKSKKENQKDKEIYGTFICIDYILTYDMLVDNTDCIG